MEPGSIGTPEVLPSDERARSPVEGADWVPNPLSRSPSQASSIRSGLRRPSTGGLATGGASADGDLYSPPRSTASSPQVRRFQTPEGCDWRPPPELLNLGPEDDAVSTPPRRHNPVATPPLPAVPRAILPVSPLRSSSVSVAVQTPTEISDWGLPMPEGSDWKPFQDEEAEVVQIKEANEIKEVKEMAFPCMDATLTLSSEAPLTDTVEAHVTGTCVDEGGLAAPPMATAPEKAPEQAAESPSEHEQLLAPSQTTAPECTPEQGNPSFVPAEDHTPAPAASPDSCYQGGKESAREAEGSEAVVLEEKAGKEDQAEEPPQTPVPRTPVRMLTPAASYPEETPKTDLQVASTTDDGSREDSQHGLSPPSSRLHSGVIPFATPSSHSGQQRKQAAKKSGKTEQLVKQPPNFMFHPSHRGSALGPPRHSHKSQAGRTMMSARSPPPPALPFSQSMRAPPCFSPSGPHRSPPVSSRAHPFARTGRSPEPAVTLAAHRVAVRSPPRALVSAPIAPPFCATSPRMSQRSPSMDARGAVSRSASITPHSPGPCHRRMLYPLGGQSAVVRQPSFAGHTVLSAGQQDTLSRTQRKFNSPTRSLSCAPIGSFVAPPGPATGSYVAPPCVGSYVAPPQVGSYVAPPQIGSFVAPPPPALWNQRYTPPDASLNAGAASLKRSYVSPPFPLSSHSPSRMMITQSLRAGAASRAPSPPGHPASSRRLPVNDRSRALHKGHSEISDA